MTDGNSKPQLHDLLPRENVGRETVARYQAQFRAAAHACLSLLEDSQLDRVYCDYQDDYVSRITVEGEVIYNFYQVKTKGKLNAQWTVNKLFGLLKSKKAKIADSDKIRQSFAGHLLIHTVRFKQSCGRVVFLTNIHVDDDIEALLAASSADNKENNHYRLLHKTFNESFSPHTPLSDDEVTGLIRKLDVESNVTYLNPHDETFPVLARDRIYKFSEIDLKHGDCEKIIGELIALVERKSFKKLVEDVDESELDDKAGIGLDDMLNLMSISKSAYQFLKDGGDPQALKSASIIQRLLSQARAPSEMIEYVSDCKVRWDIWLREKRHTMAEFDINFLQAEISKVATSWANMSASLEDLKMEIETLLSKVQDEKISNSLTRDVLLGGVFAAAVRNEAL